ncbi:MAG: lipocalin family protein, partial [Chloroflexota bacterium]
TEMMIGNIRFTDERGTPVFGGLYVRQDATTEYIEPGTFTITPTDHWTSDYSGVEYPVAWEIAVDGEYFGQDEMFVIQVEAMMHDQELHTSPTYWEGAVTVTGHKTGVGYAELTGYVDAMDGFF